LALHAAPACAWEGPAPTSPSIVRRPVGAVNSRRYVWISRHSLAIFTKRIPASQHRTTLSILSISMKENMIYYFKYE
jgi:hypothetical protein